MLANRSSSTTVPLPANLSEDPDDENGGSSNNATAATLSSSIVYTTTDEVVGGEVEVSLPRNDTHHIKLYISPLENLPILSTNMTID